MSKVFMELNNAIRITGFYSGKCETTKELDGTRICMNELLIPFSSGSKDGVDIGISEADLLEVLIMRCGQRLSEIAENRFRGNFGALPENVEFHERQLKMLQMRLKGCQMTFNELE